MDTITRLDLRSQRNLTMLVDFYELTMANGYLSTEADDTIAYLILTCFLGKFLMVVATA